MELDNPTWQQRMKFLPIPPCHDCILHIFVYPSRNHLWRNSAVAVIYIVSFFLWPNVIDLMVLIMGLMGLHKVFFKNRKFRTKSEINFWKKSKEKISELLLQYWTLFMDPTWRDSSNSNLSLGRRIKTISVLSLIPSNWVPRFPHFYFPKKNSKSKSNKKLKIK